MVEWFRVGFYKSDKVWEWNLFCLFFSYLKKKICLLENDLCFVKFIWGYVKVFEISE